MDMPSGSKSLYSTASEEDAQARVAYELELRRKEQFVALIMRAREKFAECSAIGARSGG